MNKFIIFFKGNKEIIILIPTLLGGMYQILNLLILVGLPYVRYFSVSQVIPDGLLISIVLFWTYLAFRIILSLYKQINEKSEKEIKHSILFNGFYIVFFCSFGIFLFYLIYTEEDFSSFGAILSRYATFAGAALFFWAGIQHFLLVTTLDSWIVNKIKNLSKDIKIFIANILIISILAILIRVVPNEIAVINKMFIKVSNFENYSFFSKEIQSTYDMKSEPVLLYINKEYAFFKMPDKERKILVVDAKSLTEIKKRPQSKD